MMNQLKHTNKEQEILKMIEVMINASISALNVAEMKIESLSIKQTYLLLVYGVVNSYSEAIFELCKQFRPQPTLVLLRAVLEAWINTSYFLSHNSNNRLYALMMHDSFVKLGFVNEVEIFSKKYPWITEKSILSEEEVGKLRLKVENDLLDYKKRGLLFNKKKELEKAAFFEKHLIDRARKADNRYKGSDKNKPAHPFEHQYLIVYRFLSDYAHISLSGANSFMKKTDNGYDFLASKSNAGVEMELVTLYIFYLSFLNKLNDFKLISVPNLNQYNNYFINTLSVKKSH